MKTVLLISADSLQYFKRVNGVWLHIKNPEHADRLWVIVNVAEEKLEPFKLPLLFGRDRSHFLQHNLVAAFPHSQYRAAPIISGSLLKPSTAVLTGLSKTESISGKLDRLNAKITGVWGMSMLLTLMLKRYAISDVILVIPSEHILRVLVIKAGIPLLSRCIHRYREDNDSDANEILRTHQHLENRRLFEPDATPSILYLGEIATIEAQLSGFTLLPIPESFTPKGEAAYLHPLFEFVTTTPRGQLAPLQLRARFLAEKLRLAAYAACVLGLLAAILFSHEDFWALINLNEREETLNSEIQHATRARDHLTSRINATGIDPVLLRQAVQFSTQELDTAPPPASLFQFAASTIQGLATVRIKRLTFRFPKQGTNYCQGHRVIVLPLINKQVDLPLGLGRQLSDNIPTKLARHTELSFSILLTQDSTSATRIKILKHISASIKAHDDVQLMQDPAAYSLINTLKGGFDKDTNNAEAIWCMSIPWAHTKDTP
ncbi:MAG: hypothetical protein R8K48_01185 [Gallionella sp.]